MKFPERAVILAGGKGTRLAPYTAVIPKPLMPVGDMPILEVVLRQLKKAGTKRVTIATGHLSHLIRTFFGNGSQLGLSIDYLVETKALGTAGPLAMLADLDEPFLVMNGDVLTDMDYRKLWAFHQKNRAAATVATHRREVKVDFGVVVTNHQHLISGYIEKPTLPYNVSMGVYLFSPEVLKFIPPNRHFDFPTLVLKLLKAKKKVASFPFSGFWLDIGRADDYARAAEFFAVHSTKFLPK
jgi:NDP-sugar pyrophosphorylase family protein